MIRKLWEKLLRSVEQLGQAQTHALGGVPDLSPSSSTAREREPRRFSPADWLEPFVHHQFAPLSWRMGPWLWTAVGLTQCGWGRTRNRENLGAVPHISWAGVASERSGRGSEGEAATWSLSQLVDRLRAQQTWMGSACALHRDECACHSARRFQHAIEVAHQALQQRLRRQQQWRGMGVSLAGLLICEQQIHLLRIGDCQIFRLRDGELQAFAPWHPTASPSPQPHAVAPAPSLFRRAPVSRGFGHTALGWGDELPVALGSLVPQRGDVYLLATREAVEVVSMSVMREVLLCQNESLAQRCQRLMDIACNTRFAHDDMTFLAVEVVEEAHALSSESRERWRSSLEAALFRDSTVS